jgi:hypothetical protein
MAAPSIPASVAVVCQQGDATLQFVAIGGGAIVSSAAHPAATASSSAAADLPCARPEGLTAPLPASAESESRSPDGNRIMQSSSCASPSVPVTSRDVECGAAAASALSGSAVPFYSAASSNGLFGSAIKRLKPSTAPPVDASQAVYPAL